MIHFDIFHRYHAAHLTNDGDYEELAQEAGKVSGDMTFPLVYTPELHFCEFESAVADMKNSVKNGDNAQSSCAGLFINANLGFDYPGKEICSNLLFCVNLGLLALYRQS